jgi:Flp pilus assembly pilin Flp
MRFRLLLSRTTRNLRDVAKLCLDEAGQDFIEYAMLMSLVALASTRQGCVTLQVGSVLHMGISTARSARTRAEPRAVLGTAIRLGKAGILLDKLATLPDKTAAGRPGRAETIQAMVISRM